MDKGGAQNYALRMKKTALAPVSCRTESVVIPTYEPALPDPNPMFLEKRVYQGSSGRVYPLPFIDRIAETKTDRAYQVVTLENEYLEVQLLPEIGGRIHSIKDKTNNFDIIYKQESIKPALVGLAGPWISGGIEFNWPQHHRPATFMPVECSIEQGEDGSVTAWMADHDPMARMRGLHGICLKPGSSVVELKVRAYNRTNDTQTFLWWANVANEVHEQYQSFFPPDVYYVADHAKRSMSAFPACQDQYYGLPYGKRAKEGVPARETPRKFVPPGTPPCDYAANDLSWYANIPVPTSYMCMGTQEDFFGGYDHKAKAGFIHFANHHVSPGKKQWTWGNHEFGYAWDRLLSDDERPYIELMAGVYTDNQPDFSFLQPGETKTWSQYWYPIRAIGVAQQATLDAAVSLTVEKKEIKVGVSVTAAHKHVVITLTCNGKPLHVWTEALSPAQPFAVAVPLPAKAQATHLRLEVHAKDGRLLATYQPKKLVAGEVPPPATEPPHPSEIKGNDELYITGLHLEQYRHATRSPVAYWQEALKRDPQDSRCHTAMGRWHLRRGELAQAEQHLRQAVDRLVRRNPNPENGEAYYQLGQCLLAQGKDAEAYAAFYKGCWNQAWASAGYHAIAELDCKRGEWAAAQDHLRRSLKGNTDNLRARNLLAMALAAQERRLPSRPGSPASLPAEAQVILQATLELDPLDSWALWLMGKPIACDAHARLDLAHDLMRAGFYTGADEVLKAADKMSAFPAGKDAGVPGLGAAPLIAYTRAYIAQLAGDEKAAQALFEAAAKTDPTYCFPARLEDIRVLETAIKANPKDALAPYLLGNLFYDRRRHGEAIACFEKAVKLNPKNAIAWRNLGIGYFNIQKNPAKAKAAYEKAVAAKTTDARLFYERDQLWKRLGESPAKRLKALEAKKKLIATRDDLTVEYGALLNQVARHAEAQVLAGSRVFQPWEGGEGMALGLHTRSHLALGRQALAKGKVKQALDLFETALSAPRNLNEARHLLANASDIHYWIGSAANAAGDQAKAKHHWTLAADFRGDFQNMSVCAYSEMTYYSALSLTALGRKAEAQKLLKGLLGFAKELKQATAKIDYFATSLPTMLLFDADIQFTQETAAMFLEAQAELGLGRKAQAKKLLAAVLKRDPNHALAADLLAGN